MRSGSAPLLRLLQACCRTQEASARLLRPSDRRIRRRRPRERDQLRPLSRWSGQDGASTTELGCLVSDEVVAGLSEICASECPNAVVPRLRSLAPRLAPAAAVGCLLERHRHQKHEQFELQEAAVTLPAILATLLFLPFIIGSAVGHRLALPVVCSFAPPSYPGGAHGLLGARGSGPMCLLALVWLEKFSRSEH